MAGGYTVPPTGDYGLQIQQLQEIRNRVAELERPTGSQIAEAVQKLQELVDGLITQVNGIFSGYVQAGGNIVAGGRVVGQTGISSLPVYSNILTTAFRAVYVTQTGSSGDFGYVPSSRQFKQDELPAPNQLEAALAIQVVTFRYKQAVEELGDAAQVEWGVIAEDIHALGFHWLIDYDDEGKPFGVKKEQLIFAFIPVIQDHEARLQAAGL